MTNEWYLEPSKTIHSSDQEAARAHQLTLTKPPGSLGQLEDIAVWFCAWQRCSKPECSDIQIVVFAADHGVCVHGISAFPQEVTAQMVNNFTSGGAAISVLAQQLGAGFSVINLGLITEIENAPTLRNTPLMSGTNDFTVGSSMSRTTLLNALEIGREAVEPNTQLFIGGDMGIGNTTAASAIYSVLLEQPPELTVGPGTGVDGSGMLRKRQALYKAFNLHGDKLEKPIDVLQHVGGLEIAALNPSTREWMIFAHRSAEPAHTLALTSLKATPLLDLEMRLGEGSGAAVATPLILSALQLHNHMATFGSAAVSES